MKLQCIHKYSIYIDLYNIYLISPHVQHISTYLSIISFESGLFIKHDEDNIIAVLFHSNRSFHSISLSFFIKNILDQ